MHNSYILTFIGKDRPGLVKRLSTLVAEFEGSWQQSQMSRLAGQFAGVVEIRLPEDKAAPLQAALNQLNAEGLSVQVTQGNPEDSEEGRSLGLTLIGPDRNGIISELSSALADHHINVTHMETVISSAPMSAEALFEAEAEAQAPAALDMNQLQDILDEVSDRVGVDISLVERHC